MRIVSGIRVSMIAEGHDAERVLSYIEDKIVANPNCLITLGFAVNHPEFGVINVEKDIHIGFNQWRYWATYTNCEGIVTMSIDRP